jgi:hypothetical protein
LLLSLDYINLNEAIRNLKINDKHVKHYDELLLTSETRRIFNDKIKQNRTLFVNESGLYYILSKTTKPIAKQFMNEYFNNIMVSIRKYGEYKVSERDRLRINVMNNKLDNLRREIIYFKKPNYVTSSHGYFYINEDTVYLNSKKLTCYKIGYTKDMNSRIANYRTGNYSYKLLAYIPLHFNRKVLEDCVKSKYKEKLIKMKTDTICYVSLKELKTETMKCIDEIKHNRCYCIKCDKSHTFNGVDRHVSVSYTHLTLPTM